MATLLISSSAPRFIGASFDRADAGNTLYYILRWVSMIGEKDVWNEIAGAAADE